MGEDLCGHSQLVLQAFQTVSKVHYEPHLLSELINFEFIYQKRHKRQLQLKRRSVLLRKRRTGHSVTAHTEHPSVY